MRSRLPVATHVRNQGLPRVFFFVLEQYDPYEFGGKFEARASLQLAIHTNWFYAAVHAPPELLTVTVYSEQK
jgi:hypothetical protein